MKLLKLLTQCTRAFYKSFHNLINGALIIAILVQILFFAIESNDYKLKVPELLLSQTKALLLENQITFDADNITIQPSGELLFENLKINHSHFNEPLVICDSLRLNLNPISLLFGKLHPKEIIIKNATFFCPPSLSPTGLNEPLINNFFGAITLSRRHIRIEQFDFDFQNLAVIAEGSWSLDSLIDSPTFNVTNYLSLSTSLLKIKNQLSLLNQPMLTLRIKENEQKEILLNLNLSALGLSTNQLQLGPLHANTQLTYQNENLSINSPLDLSIKNIDWNNKQLLAKTAQAQLTLDLQNNPDNTIPFIKTIKVFLSEILTHNLNIDSAAIESDLTHNNPFPSTISALHNNNWTSITGNIDLETKSINGFIKGSSDLKELKEIASQFTSLNLLKYTLDGRINWQGQLNAHQDQGFHLDKSKFIVTSKKLNYDDLHVDKLYAELSLNDAQLNIPYISIEGGENYAKGSISQNFKTGDYRYLLTGAIIPDSLNSYLGDWWKELLAKFQFSAPMPFGNMDVQGNLFDSSKWIVFGEVQANNFVYSGIPIKTLSFRINSNENELELIDLLADSTNGSLQAYTQFQYVPTPPRENIASAFVDGSSSLPLQDLDTIINLPSVHNILKEFSSTQGPNLTVKGKIYTDNQAATQIKAQFQTNQEISYHNIPFDHLNFNANYTPSKTTIDNLSCGFAKGSGNGSLIITPNNNSPASINANLHLTSVNQELAVKSLLPLWPTTYQPQTKANNYGGLVNLNLETTGTLGQWKSFTGSGNISITQATLGKIHLLWILSEILSPLMPFGLGSLHLTDATSNFLIRDGAIHFPNINVFGSTASIDGEGNFYLESQNLDFILDISPMNKKGIPILSQALLVFTPITQSFQMRLGGTLQNPKWETTLTPLGLFKKKGPGLPLKNDVAK